MASISGKAGGVYSAPLLVENCEDAWEEHSELGCTSSSIAGKVGTYAARVTTVSVGADKVMMSEAITKDLTDYHGLIYWARTSLATTAVQLKLLLDDTAECASPVETLAIPILTPAAWRQCFNKFADPTGLGSLISIGLYCDVDLTNGTFDIDDVYAVKLIGGIKSWTLDALVEVLETTDFTDGQATNSGRTYIPGLAGWSGAFEGDKDGAPLGLGLSSSVHLALQESAAPGQGWIGMAFITGIHPNVAVDGTITYTYDFQGTGELSEATL